MVGRSCGAGIHSVHLVGKDVGQGVLLEVPEGVQENYWHVDPSEVALGQGKDLVPEVRLAKARSGVLQSVSWFSIRDQGCDGQHLRICLTNSLAKGCP